jgi:transcription elongation factor SPT4
MACSANFDGFIAATQPDESWVCKWQVIASHSFPPRRCKLFLVFKKIDRKTKGIYAVSVSGSLPGNVVRELKNQGIRYKANMRDMTTK